MLFRAALIVFILQSGFLLSQEYSMKFNSMIGLKDTAALRQLLTEWKQNKPDDPEMYTSWFNYHILKARKEITAMNSRESEDSSLVITDSSGNPVYYIHGDYFYDEREAEIGIAVLNEGIKKHQRRLDMYFGKAWLLGDMGRFKEQTEVIKQVIEISVKIKNSWLWTKNEEVQNDEIYMLSNIQNYFVTLFENQKIDEVLDASTFILKHYPKHVESFSNIAICYFYKNDYDKSLEYLFKAEKLAPTDPVILSNMAYAYKQKKNNSKAIKYYERVKKFGDQADKEFAENQINELKKQ